MRIVDTAELKRLHEDPRFTAWNTSTVVSVICAYCERANTITPASDNQTCQSCGADLKKGKLLVGLLGAEGVFLDLDLLDL